jgi:hypothetical protein
MVVYIVYGPYPHEDVAGVYLRRVDAEAFRRSRPRLEYEVREHDVVVKADSGAFGESSVG